MNARTTYVCMYVNVLRIYVFMGACVCMSVHVRVCVCARARRARVQDHPDIRTA